MGVFRLEILLVKKDTEYNKKILYILVEFAVMFFLDSLQTNNPEQNGWGKIIHMTHHWHHITAHECILIPSHNNRKQDYL